MSAKGRKGEDLKLGILGGTFDPIHYGHLAAAEEAQTRLHLEIILFAPVAIPPHKPNEIILPLAHRLAMVALAIASNPHFALCRVDIDRPPPYYSVDTVRLVREKWGLDSEHLFFIMGLDSLRDLPSWHHPQELMQLCRLAVVCRPGYQADLKGLERKLPGLLSRLEIVEMPLLDISSTELRSRVREGRSIRYLVPEGVEAYVRQHGLYLADNCFPSPG